MVAQHVVVTINVVPPATANLALYDNLRFLMIQIESVFLEYRFQDVV